MPNGVTWWPKLWNIIKTVLPGGGPKFDFSHAKNCIVVYNPQSSSPVTVSGDILALNSAHFQKMTQELSPIFREILAQPDECVMEKTALSTIEDIQTHENKAAVKQEIEYFRGILPTMDLTILRACFYLKKVNDENTRQRDVAQLKSQIVRNYGKRGANMANLCTANYFETWIIPLYKEIATTTADKMNAAGKFREIFNTIIEELPRTVFVSQTMSSADLQKQAIYKLEKIKSYGTAFLSIHALGKANVNKVRSVLPVIEQQFPDIAKNISEEGNRIIVQLQFQPLAQN